MKSVTIIAPPVAVVQVAVMFGEMACVSFASAIFPNACRRAVEVASSVYAVAAAFEPLTPTPVIVLSPKLTVARSRSPAATPTFVGTVKVVTVPPVPEFPDIATRKAIAGSITYGTGSFESSSVSCRNQRPAPSSASDHVKPFGVMTWWFASKICTGLTKSFCDRTWLLMNAT